MDLEISEKYEPLFKRPSGVDTYIITGGRFSSKSFTVAIAVVIWVLMNCHRVLYGRWTNTSSKDSTFPEVEEKIEMLGYEPYFNVNNNRIDVLDKKGKIVFKGFKTGSKTQTAALKSLKDFSCLVVDEAEEIPDYDTFDKVSLSIRGNGNEDEEPNIKVLMMNPTTKEHWIYKEFFEDAGVEEGFNGVKGNVCYIHTSYLDCIKHVPKDILIKYNKAREAYEEYLATAKELRDELPFHIRKLYRYYKYTLLGGWLDKAEGVIFEDWKIGEFDDTLPSVYGMDFGYVTDPTTLYKVAQTSEKIYIKEYLYKGGMSTSQIIDFLDVTVDKSDLIVADSAEPRLIDELILAGFNVVKCRKGKDSVKNGIAAMRDKEIITHKDDINLHKELNNYVWVDKKSNTPVDAWNHGIDAVRYAHDELNTQDFWVT